MDPAALISLYPSLSALPADRLAADLRALGEIDVPDRTTLFRETEPCVGFPMVLEGQVRVARGSPDGRELELYRVHPGEICIVSTGCLLGSTPMNAHGTTQGRTRLLVVDRATLLGWTAAEPFRTFLLGLLADRMADLMALVEAVAFQRMDRRLAAALLGRGRLIRSTHQQLADDLGTAREMVSRLLKRFEEQGWVALGREQIEILDAGALRGITDAP
ncbi:MAG: Crp/Fnr family transcriptional regulator [Burkholderiaceae bacterium]